jgi:diguanylate cyclase (GGDEF)-like protein
MKDNRSEATNQSEQRAHPGKYRFNHLIKGPQDRIESLKKETEMLRKESRMDSLTGLPNEKELHPFLAGLEDSFRRNSLKGVANTGTFIAMDLTGLHATNDEFGRNSGGDAYIRAVADSLKDSIRPEDRCFRLGSQSDEFVIHLHEVNSRDEQNKIMDRIDEKLKLAQYEHQAKYPGIEFSLSYAVASYGGRYSPIGTYGDAVNSLGEAKKSKNGERIGNVGRIFVE